MSSRFFIAMGCGDINTASMGEVYVADDLTLDRKVALKFLPDAFTGYRGRTQGIQGILTTSLLTGHSS